MKTEPTANILVVDDDLKTLLALEALLSGPGRNIVVASSGTEALRHLLREDFALILMDVRLPEMDGFETAALIRQRERFRYTPIIFLSAIDTLESDVFRGVASGAVDYLFKPVVPQVLQAKVSVFVDLYRMNERLKRQALEQSEERFRGAVEASPNAMIMVTESGQIALVNAHVEKLFGYDRSELLGQSIERLVPERFRRQHSFYRSAFFADPRARPMGAGRDLYGLRKDGSEVSVEIGLNPIETEEGRFVLASVIDITERKRAEEELKRLNAELERRFAEKTAELGQTIGEREKLQAQLLQSQKMESVGTLAGGIAHDMNNLLNVISGYASVILQDPANIKEVTQCVEIIKESVGRGGSLVQQLLATVRKTELKFARVQVNGVLEKLQALLKDTFPRTIDIELDLEPALPSVMADANLLHQAVLNLCLNARDAMPAGGELRIETRTMPGAELRHIFQDATQEHYACVTVKDTGIGMDRVTKNRIFEPFFTTKPQGEGTGLGLSVVYGIIVNHTGFIDVDTEPGHGTTFRLCLPIPTDAVSAVELEARAAGKDGQELLGRGEIILFAEDEMRQLRLMENFLESKGYRVLPAKDGAEAVEIFCQNKDDIALVILDLGLPKLNGWEALRKIREIDPYVKAIFATGFMAPQVESQLPTGSVSAVIMKPYQLDEVLQSIAGVIKKPPAENTIATSPV